VLKYNIIERAVMKAFSYGILVKWQFHDFCKDNSRSNLEFKRTVERMIAAEQKTQERLPDRNNLDNPDRQNHQSNEQHGRKVQTRQHRGRSKQSQEVFQTKKV
jgi:hypothetical protein